MQLKIDVLDKNGTQTGTQSTISNALRRGLWHRGVHVVIVSNTGYILAQKRSETMRMHPGMLDISCGGFVDAGETPQQAAVREVHEELGLTITQNALIPLLVQRKNHVWSKLGIHDRAIINCYLVVVDHHLLTLRAQPDEVSWAGFITIREAKTLIARHRVKRLGRLQPTYAFYKRIIAIVEKEARKQQRRLG